MADSQISPRQDEFLPLRENDHILGQPDADIILIEFGDYECEACGEAYRVIGRLRKELGSELCFAFRHFPFSGIHPHAELAAQAAEAAGAQGKFWEMHALLFDNQGKLEFDDLVDYAGRIGIDVERFRSELESEKYLEHVREDFRIGVQNGVFTTPGLFINGIRLNESWRYESLMAAIERERENVGAARPKS